MTTRNVLDGPGIEFQWGRDFPHPCRPAPRPTQPAHTIDAGSFAGDEAAGAWWYPPTSFKGRFGVDCSCIAESEREGTRAEIRIGLSAKRTSPFKSTGGSVQSTTGRRGVRMKDARLLATHSIRIFPLHFPSRASPCAVSFRFSSTSVSPFTLILIPCARMLTWSSALRPVLQSPYLSEDTERWQCNITCYADKIPRTEFMWK